MNRLQVSFGTGHLVPALPDRLRAELPGLCLGRVLTATRSSRCSALEMRCMATVQVRNRRRPGIRAVLKQRASRSGRSLQESPAGAAGATGRRNLLGLPVPPANPARVDMAWTVNESAPTMDDILEIQRAGPRPLIVIDNSALVEAVIGAGGRSRAVARRIEHERLAAPELIDVEAVSTIRGLVLGGKLSADRGRRSRSGSGELPDTSRSPRSRVLERSGVPTTTVRGLHDRAPVDSRANTRLTTDRSGRVPVAGRPGRLRPPSSSDLSVDAWVRR